MTSWYEELDPIFHPRAMAVVGVSEGVENQGMSFDPFFTTKPVGKGTGMGLSISYQIVTERHGGSLHCTSAPGVGAEFAIEIPLKANS